MRNSKILQRLRAGQPARLALMGHYVPSFIAYAAHLGYDGIWLDLEHRPMDDREVQALLAFFHLYDIDCMLRPATRDKAPLYRYLEDGAAGLVVPHISTVDEARDLVRKVKFPPIGDRGLNGNSLEANFGLDIQQGRDALVAHALRETFLVLQIETPQAVAEIEAIAAVPGVDGLFVGPADLSIRMKLEPDERRLPYDETLARVAAAARKHNLAWGTMPWTADEVRGIAQQGANLLVWGNEASILLNGLKQTGRDLDAILAST